jgi:hypothetical protein
MYRRKFKRKSIHLQGVLIIAGACLGKPQRVLSAAVETVRFSVRWYRKCTMLTFFSSINACISDNYSTLTFSFKSNANAAMPSLREKMQTFKRRGRSKKFFTGSAS